MRKIDERGKAEAKKAWAEVADALESLALSLKLHYRERAADGPGRPPADPIRDLAAKVTGAVSAVGGAVGDPAVGRRVAEVSESVEHALRETARAIPPSGRHAVPEPVHYLGDVLRAAEENDDFRRVLFTGAQSQLVVMTLPPGEELGAGEHPADQVLLLLGGEGECSVGGRARALTGHDALCVPGGVRHNVRNTGTGPLRLAVVYAPAHHRAGTVHRTRADAA